MDSSSSSSSSSSSARAHGNMPIQSFAALSPENHLAVLEQAFLESKPTLRSLASTNRQMYMLATPLLIKASIEHVENTIQTMAPGAKVAALLLINRKLVENADNLPVLGCETLWERFEALVLKEIANFPLSDDIHKGLEGIINSHLTSNMSFAQTMAIQRCVAIFKKMCELGVTILQIAEINLKHAIAHTN